MLYCSTMRVEDSYMKSYATLVVSLFAVVLLFTSVAEAGKGKKRKKDEKNSDHSSGTIEYIIDHAIELKVTPDQITKLEALQAAEEAAMSDPATTAILQKVHDAKKAGNHQAVLEQKERLSEKIKERTGGKFGGLREELNKILTPEQQTALAEMRKKGAEKDPNAKDDPKMPKAINPFEL